MGMYSPSDADVELMDDLAIKINAMGNTDPNKLVAIANKIVEILPTLNADGRVYYVLEWIYDTIDLVIAREREQLAIKIAMMESGATIPPAPADTNTDSSSTTTTPPAGTTTPAPTDSGTDNSSTTPAPEETTWAAIQVDVTGSNFSFSESTIYVSLGDTVTVNFESTEWTHDWKVDEFDAATEVVTSADGVTSVTFVADTLGTFEYYCSVGNHRAQGMAGNLVVE